MLTCPSSLRSPGRYKQNIGSIQFTSDCAHRVCERLMFDAFFDCQLVAKQLFLVAGPYIRPFNETVFGVYIHHVLILVQKNYTKLSGSHPM